VGRELLGGVDLPLLGRVRDQVSEDAA
jgi:hypothetical protein